MEHMCRFDEGNPLAEKSTLRVAILTAAMLVIEIAGGWYYTSMALLA
jgi:Co/Zn/Cd efflux system component